jgi:hypothetical protein
MIERVCLWCMAGCVAIHVVGLWWLIIFLWTKRAIERRTPATKQRCSKQEMVDIKHNTGSTGGAVGAHSSFRHYSYYYYTLGAKLGLMPN